MEAINLIKNLINELDQAKTKINKLKTKLSTKELDIMNLKKDNIRLFMELEQYKLNTKSITDMNDLYIENIEEQQEYYLEEEEEEELVEEEEKVFEDCTDNQNNINAQKITDSLLLNCKNKLKCVDTVNIPKKESSGISKSIIINQRNKLKNIVLSNRLPEILPIPATSSNDDMLATAILAIGRLHYGNEYIDNTLTDSWL